MGHKTRAQSRQGVAEVIVVNPETGVLEGGVDGRAPDAAPLAISSDSRGFGRPPAAEPPDQHRQDVKLE